MFPTNHTFKSVVLRWKTKKCLYYWNQSHTETDLVHIDDHTNQMESPLITPHKRKVRRRLSSKFTSFSFNHHSSREKLSDHLICRQNKESILYYGRSLQHFAAHLNIFFWNKLPYRALIKDIRDIYMDLVNREFNKY